MQPLCKLSPDAKVGLRIGAAGIGALFIFGSFWVPNLKINILISSGALLFISGISILPLTLRRSFFVILIAFLTCIIGIATWTVHYLARFSDPKLFKDIAEFPPAAIGIILGLTLAASVPGLLIYFCWSLIKEGLPVKS